MFYIYANGKSIYQPMDNTLSLFSPKLTLEMGKAGSLQFQIPPSNKYYNALPQLTTTITVEMDDIEIFRGRVLTNNRNFNNVRTIYCEGDLAYLVDSVQKAEKYDGKAHALFRKIIAAHNARVEASKRFTVGNITVEDRDVLLTGKSDDIQDAETGKFDYKQIAINSIADEWQNTFDFIETCLIDYTGGYLRTRRQNGVTYVDLLADYGTTATQDIEFGKNLLDLTEEVSAEDVFTVLIPLGDENLTIESVNNGSDELVDVAAVARYGRIVKTHASPSYRRFAMGDARRSVSTSTPATTGPVRPSVCATSCGFLIGERTMAMFRTTSTSPVILTTFGSTPARALWPVSAAESI